MGNIHAQSNTIVIPASALAWPRPASRPSRSHLLHAVVPQGEEMLCFSAVIGIHVLHLFTAVRKTLIQDLTDNSINI